MATTKSPFEKLLATGQKKVKELAAEAKKKGGGAPVDDGDYIAQYTSNRIGSSDGKDGTPRNWVLRNFTVLEDLKHDDGKNVGLIAGKFSNVNEESDLEFLMADHRRMEVDIEADDYDLTQLQEIEDALVNAPTVMKIRVKTNTSKTDGREYTQVYLLSVISDYEGKLAMDEEETESEAEEEAPAPKAKKKAAVVEEDDDEDETPAPKAKAKAKSVAAEDEDEDDDEEEAPAPKKKTATPPPTKKGGKPVAAANDDDDEDDEDDEEEAPEAEDEAGVAVGTVVHWLDEAGKRQEGKVTECLLDIQSIKVQPKKKGLNIPKPVTIALSDDDLGLGTWEEADAAEENED